MIANNKKLYVGIGVLLALASLVLSIVVRPKLAPEFSGTTEIVITLDTEISVSEIEQKFASTEYVVLVERDDEAYTLTTSYLDDEGHRAFTNTLEEVLGTYTSKSYQSFSPSISAELVRKALLAVIFAAIIIIIFISYTFRKVSHPVDSYKYGVVSIIALIHDILIPFGVFTLLALHTDAVIDTLFVTAMLATLGYSINDTIVVFDRIRERLNFNAEKKKKESFSDVVDHGVRSSIRRSIYTSLSTALPLLLLAIFVPVMQWFSIALLIGILAGTYSSLFFAPSLLLLWHTYFPQSEKKAKKMTETELAEERLREMLTDDTL